MENKENIILFWLKGKGLNWSYVQFLSYYIFERNFRMSSVTVLFAALMVNIECTNKCILIRQIWVKIIWWIMMAWTILVEGHQRNISAKCQCFHVILGHLGPHFPSTCMSKAVLTAPLERSTYPYQRSLFFRMRSRSSMPSCASSLDLVVTLSCGLTLQTCLIIALSFHCRRWRFGFINGQVSLAWSIGLCTQELYMPPHALKETWREERTGSSSLNFFQAVFTHVVVES